MFKKWYTYKCRKMQKKVIVIRKIYNKIFLLVCIIFLLSFENVYGAELVSASAEISEEYLEWEDLSAEEKENIPMPSMYSASVSKEMLEKENKKNDFTKIIEKYATFSKELGTAKPTDSRYSLNESIEIDVKDQMQTQCCWSIAILTSMETNLKLTKGIDVDLSERHLDYSTSEDFYDGINPYAFKRSVKQGGNTTIGLAYLTNGQGAVLEEEMKFINNLDKISLSEINIAPSIYVTEYTEFPAINKTFDYNGNVICFDDEGNTLTNDELTALRNTMKEHIIKYGGIVAYTAATQYDYYSSPDIASSKAYYCNTDAVIDHAITIVGWDDTYSRENFTGKAKPQSDGAYIVLNSYSENCFENGYMYISYEDFNIETSLYGITETSEINYDNLYQHNEFGASVYITPQKGNGETTDILYYSNTYTRETNEKENLNSVSICSNEYCRYEVYINPNGENLNIDGLTKVASTEVLGPGYHTVEFNPVLLSGDKFSVVIKEIPIDNVANLMIEPQIDGTFFEYVTANVGDSKISIDGKNWSNLADLGRLDAGGLIIDLTRSDVCIKAFTTIAVEAEIPLTIESEVYSITADKHIMKIYDNSKLSEVLSQISINKDYKIYDKDNIEVTNLDSLVCTNMYLQINDEKYYFAVRGDINGDGKITLIDLSKQIACYAELEGYELYGTYRTACDFNLDGKFSLIDVSQFLYWYNNM